MRGIGKTALSVKLAQQLQNQFEYVIWRSLRNAPPVLEILANLSQDETIKLRTVKTGECLRTLRAARPYEVMNITGVTG
jgi:MinD superfamily P-loop ATPase